MAAALARAAAGKQGQRATVLMTTAVCVLLFVYYNQYICK
jgi:hypothetical protein